jgi:hypothetical protein
MVAPKDNLSLTPLRILSFSKEQIKSLFTSRIFFHPFCLWMKKIIRKKFGPKTFGLQGDKCVGQYGRRHYKVGKK